MRTRVIGLVYDLLGTHPPREADPLDVDAEYEPESTAHFRVPIERGIEIFRALRGRTSGYAIPGYVLDTPHGKVPLAQPHLRGRDGDHGVVETYEGKLWREPNPSSWEPGGGG